MVFSLEVDSLADLVAQLGIIIIASAVLAYLGRKLKQPPIVAYILSGVLLGVLGLDIAQSREFLDVVAHIGIIFMLYIAGLKIRFKDFSSLGKKVLLIGPVKDIVIILIGFFIGTYFFGFEIIPSLYLGIALTLSSTIIIIKTLTKRKEVATPHGKILIAMMLFQDLIAMSALAIFTSLHQGGGAIPSIVLTFIKGGALFIGLLSLGNTLVKHIFAKLGDKLENVFLIGLTWCFSSVVIAHFIGFSTEIAAFMAGMSIAHLPFSFEIRDKTIALQEFGLILFFFTIGATTVLSKEIIFSYAFWVLLLLVMVITPLITMIIGSFLGFEKKKTFLIGVLPIQVSEFSIILVMKGLQLGQISNGLFTMIVLLTVVSMIISSSVLANIGSLYDRLQKHLKILEWNKKRTFHKNSHLEHHIVIFGFGGLGKSVARHFKGKKKIVIVEWDPEKIDEIQSEGFIVISGDAGDSDVWDEANLHKADLLVSTIGENLDDDLRLGEWIRKKHPRMVSIAETVHANEVKSLKKAGYDFVMQQDEAEWEVLKEYLEKTHIKRRIIRDLEDSLAGRGD